MCGSQMNLILRFRAKNHQEAIGHDRIEQIYMTIITRVSICLCHWSWRVVNELNVK